jgi:hypothetical protein
MQHVSNSHKKIFYEFIDNLEVKLEFLDIFLDEFVSSNLYFSLKMV